LLVVSLLMVSSTTYIAAAAQTTTQAERMAQVSRMFKMTGQEFVNEVLANCRGGDPSPNAEMRARINVKDHEFEGRRWYRFSSKEVAPQGKIKKILYLHGGGYVLSGGPAQFAFVEYLMQQTGAEVWFPEYPLAPEHSCMDALRMTTELYRLMLKESPAEEIVVMGDSAGGGLSLTSTMYFRENKLPLPNNLILISPSVNMLFMPRNDESPPIIRNQEIISKIFVPKKLKYNNGNAVSQPMTSPFSENRLKGINGKKTGVNTHPAKYAAHKLRIALPPLLHEESTEKPCTFKPAKIKNMAGIKIK